MKAYSFQELALEYFPDRTPSAAVKQLNSWIVNIPDLEDRLVAAGRYKNQKIMTPLQTSIIVEYLGEPDKWAHPKERQAGEQSTHESNPNPKRSCKYY